MKFGAGQDRSQIPGFPPNLEISVCVDVYIYSYVLLHCALDSWLVRRKVNNIIYDIICLHVLTARLDSQFIVLKSISQHFLNPQ